MYKIYCNVCLCNCYDICSFKMWVKDGVIIFVEGVLELIFIYGIFCVKGLSYLCWVYSFDCIKYFMVQDVCGSGNWCCILWEEVMQCIVVKMLEIKKKDGFMFGLVLIKYFGKFGVLNYVVEGMMFLFGYIICFVGMLCWFVGIDV